MKYIKFLVNIETEVVFEVEESNKDIIIDNKWDKLIKNYIEEKINKKEKALSKIKLNLLIPKFLSSKPNNRYIFKVEN